MLRNPDHVLKGLVRGIRNDKLVKDKTEGGHEGHLQSGEGLCSLQKAEPGLGCVGGGVSGAGRGDIERQMLTL